MANKTFSSLAKGTWSAVTAYTVGDIVDNNGSSYACIANTTNNEPPNATYWALLSSKGDTGATGPQGPTGNRGVTWQGDWSAGTYNADDGVAHNGSSWIALATTTEEPSAVATDWDILALKGTDGAGSGDVSSNTATSVDSEIALFSSTTGKLIKRATGSGVAIVTSGVLSTKTNPSGDFVGTTDTQTLSGKTLTTPTIASFANAGHTHADAAGGGQLGDSAIADTADVKISTITFIIDGGGSAITTGIKGDLEIPFNCTINRVTLLADQSGSIVVDIWKDTYANFPPTDADSITASAPPTISSATKSQDSTLTGWTTSITAGDTLRFNVDSITTCTRVTLSLKVTKS